MKVNAKGEVGPPAFEAHEKKGGVFIDPNSGGRKDPWRAREGVVSNPGVRKISSEIGPRCPVCGQNSLKMHMNRKHGERVYCSNPSCHYDQSKNEQAPDGGVKPNKDVKILDGRNPRPGTERGVKIIRQTRMG